MARKNKGKGKPGQKKSLSGQAAICLLALPLALTAIMLLPAPVAADTRLIETAPAITFFEDLFAWSKYSVRIGPGFLYSPDYEGSNNYKMRLIPSVDLRWKKIAYFHDKSLRVNLLQKGWVKLGPMMSYSPGRSEGTNSALAGLGNVGNGLELGGFAESVVGPFAVKFDIQKEVAGGHGGWISHVETGFLLYKKEKLSMVAGGRLSLAGKNYMNSFFGITNAQSAASGLPAFHAKGGIKDIGLGLLTDYTINDNLAVGSLLGCSRLLGDAANSPLVQERGSANQCIGMVRLSYQIQ